MEGEAEQTFFAARFYFGGDIEKRAAEDGSVLDDADDAALLDDEDATGSVGGRLKTNWRGEAGNEIGKRETRRVSGTRRVGSDRAAPRTSGERQ